MATCNRQSSASSCISLLIDFAWPLVSNPLPIPQGIPTLLPWLDALLLSVRRQLPSFRGEELVKMLEALGRIKFKPREE